MVIVSHPMGNQNLRAVLNGFEEAGLLSGFYTSIATFPGDLSYKLGSLPGLSEIKRRSYSTKIKSVTHTHPARELGRLLAPRLKFNNLAEHEKGYFCIDKVSHSISKFTADRIVAKKKSIKAVYAYEDAALELFERSKELGLLNFYDLPIGYWRTARHLMQQEFENRPEWASTLTGFKDSQEKLLRKDEELKLADHIFVASSFTKKTLESFPHKLAPVSVIPYGFPEPSWDRTYEKPDGRPLKLLFVGGLSQRKGIANLLEAVEHLGDAITLTIVGRKPVEDCVPLNEGLKKHTYIPTLNHAGVLQAMREHDIFVFPSLFEGFGLVITEAMSQGTPVITTDRTAGADLLEDGKDGWLVEAGSTDSLRLKIEEILKDPYQVEKLGRAAREKAARRPWSVYGAEMAMAIKTLLA